MFLVLILYATFGFTFTLGKLILFYCKPFFMVACRMLIGGLGLLGYYAYSKHTQYVPRLKDWPYYLQVILFGIFLPYSLRAWGLQYITSTKAAFIFTLMPLCTALFSYHLRKERLHLQQIMGLIIGFVGMVPIFLTSSKLEDLAGGINIFSWPELAILGAVISFSYNLIALQTLVKEKGCPTPLANGISMLSSGILAAGVSFAIEKPWIHGDVRTLIFILAIQIIASNFICSNLQGYLLRIYNPTFMAFAGFLTPLCAAFFGWLILNEEMYISYLVSLMMVLFGLILFTQTKSQAQQ